MIGLRPVDGLGAKAAQLVMELKAHEARPDRLFTSELLSVGPHKAIGLQQGDSSCTVEWSNSRYLSCRVIQLDFPAISSTPARLAYRDQVG